MWRSPHVQTLWAPQLRRLPVLPRRLERVALPDGDHLWLHRAGPEPVPGAPLVVPLHGLSGSSDSQYIVGLQHALAQRGIPSAAMNVRGAGGRPNDRARMSHAGDGADLRAVLEYLHALHPGARLVPVGYSLGGSMLLHMLAEGAPAGVCGAVTVCVPLDLADGQRRLNRGFSRVYRNHLIRELVQHVRARLPHLLEVAPEEARRLAALGTLENLRTFRDYDNAVVCPLFGFRDADDYYERCSALPRLKHVAVPTLMIQAPDDPFMTAASLPSAADVSDHIRLELRNGGHVGFVEGLPWRPRYWLEQRIPDFIESLLPAPSTSGAIAGSAAGTG